MKLRACILSLVLLFLTACAGWQPAAQHDAVLELAVKAATARVLHEKPAWRPDIQRITANALEHLQAPEATTLANLEAYVAAQVPWSQLMPEEEELARLTLKMIRQETENYLEAQGITAPDQTIVAVTRVLGWIREVATRAG